MYSLVMRIPRRIRAKYDFTSNDVKQALGNVCLTCASALFVFVFVTAEVDMNMYLPWEKRWPYAFSSIAFAIIGVLFIASKKRDLWEYNVPKKVQIWGDVHTKDYRQQEMKEIADALKRIADREPKVEERKVKRRGRRD